jgi:integrase
MVWTAGQCGAFLDSAADDRLYPLYHLAAYWGLRRGELCRLERADLYLRSRRLHVRGDVKSDDSDREIIIDEHSCDVLKAWRKVQLAGRLSWGPARQDSGRVFTREDGSPLRDAKVTSVILGHSTSSFTADVYTSVGEELAESAAVAAFVPRKGRLSQQ